MDIRAAENRLAFLTWPPDREAEMRQTLSEVLWSAYASHVTVNCRRRCSQVWVLDEMAEELASLAVSYETHRTF